MDETEPKPLPDADLDEAAGGGTFKLPKNPPSSPPPPVTPVPGGAPVPIPYPIL